MDIHQLQQIPLFHEVAPSDLQALLTLMPRQTFSAGELILEGRSLGDKMYIVLSGQVRIFIEEEEDDYRLTIALIGAGQVFGELSLLDQAPRAASVIAETEAEMLLLHRVDFLAFINERPQVGIAMMQNLATIIRYSNTYLEQFAEWGQRLLEQEDYDQVMAEAAQSSTDQHVSALLDAFLIMVRRLHERRLLKG